METQGAKSWRKLRQERKAGIKKLARANQQGASEKAQGTTAQKDLKIQSIQPKAKAKVVASLS